jgi:hypothetical protein
VAGFRVAARKMPQVSPMDAVCSKLPCSIILSRGSELSSTMLLTGRTFGLCRWWRPVIRDQGTDKAT